MTELIKFKRLCLDCQEDIVDANCVCISRYGFYCQDYKGDCLKHHKEMETTIISKKYKTSCEKCIKNNHNVRLSKAVKNITKNFEEDKNQGSLYDNWRSILSTTIKNHSDMHSEICDSIAKSFLEKITAQ